MESYLRTLGEVFRSFRGQDSGCVSYGVQLPDGERWFVKEPTTASAQASLDRAWTFHQAVRHPAIVPQLHRIPVPNGHTATVMPWRPGESLYGPARARFRTLPLASVLRAIDRVLDAHLAVEAAGMVAVDLYDGAFLYDFYADALYLIDLDEYRPGPFVLQDDRLPGSARFMAPEEWHRGALVDIRTTVYALGRTAHVLLEAGDHQAWRGTPRQLAVVERATRADPAERFTGVREFTDAWRVAT
ncbi:serine/threonine protein kinase [Streptomyces galilaeus]